MISKKVSLINASLLLLGANPINSLDEETAEAVAAQSFYERSYQALLGMFPWKFAQKYKQLALVANEQPIDPRFQYVFRLPQDNLWVQHTIPNRYEFKIIGNTLHTTVKEISIKYTWRVEEELMPILFEQTFMYYLASQMCITITEDTNKAAVLANLFFEHLKRAKAVDSQQEPQDGFQDLPLDTIRYGH